MYALFRAGCLPPTYTLPRVCFGKARTPTEARRAAPRLGSYGQDNNVRGVPPLCIVFLDFPSAHVSRRLFASNIHAAACMFRQSANAKGTPDSLSSVGVFIDKTTSFTNAPRLLCDVFLNFRSRSARSRSATFRRSFGRQSTPSLP